MSRTLVGHRDYLSVFGHKHGEGIESDLEQARWMAASYLPGLSGLCKVGWLGRSTSFPGAGQHKGNSFAEAATAPHLLLPEDALKRVV